MSFKEYLQTLPWIPHLRKTKTGVTRRIALASRAIHWSFPDVPEAERNDAIQWLEELHLAIPYGAGEVKELLTLDSTK